MDSRVGIGKNATKIYKGQFAKQPIRMVQPSIPSNLKSFFHIRLSDQHKTDPPPAQHSLSSDEDVMSATIRKKDIDNNVECSSLSSLSSSPTHEEEQMARIETSKSSVQEPYSVFSKSQKIVIVAISSFAGLLSPLSANTYFPALPVIEEVMTHTRIRTDETVSYTCIAGTRYYDGTCQRYSHSVHDLPRLITNVLGIFG